MADPIADGAGGGDKGLAQHLAAKNTLRAVLGTHPAKDIHLDRLKVEQRQKLGNRIWLGGITVRPGILHRHPFARGRPCGRVGLAYTETPSSEKDRDAPHGH